MEGTLESYLEPFKELENVKIRCQKNSISRLYNSMKEKFQKNYDAGERKPASYSNLKHPPSIVDFDIATKADINRWADNATTKKQVHRVYSLRHTKEKLDRKEGLRQEMRDYDQKKAKEMAENCKYSTIDVIKEKISKMNVDDIYKKGRLENFIDKCEHPSERDDVYSLVADKIIEEQELELAQEYREAGIEYL